MRKLIINADDFGLSKLFNKRILELIEDGAVTSTSVLIDEIDESQKEQVEKLKELSEGKPMSVGLHVYFKNKDFEQETQRQYNKFTKVFGLKPHYLDIHKMDHVHDGGFETIQKKCIEENIPCKNISFLGDVMMDGVITTKHSVLDATKKPFAEIEKWVSSMDEGIYCINFHPGYHDPESTSSFDEEREVDAENISRLVKTLPKHNTKLVNFNDIKNT
jgi:predicted glycoside hydrolase/deacetylase ChbG (UPF0249 family)